MQTWLSVIERGLAVLNCALLLILLFFAFLFSSFFPFFFLLSFFLPSFLFSFCFFLCNVSGCLSLSLSVYVFHCRSLFLCVSLVICFLIETSIYSFIYLFIYSFPLCMTFFGFSCHCPFFSLSLSVSLSLSLCLLSVCLSVCLCTSISLRTGKLGEQQCYCSNNLSVPIHFILTSQLARAIHET